MSVSMLPVIFCTACVENHDLTTHSSSSAGGIVGKRGKRHKNGQKGICKNLSSDANKQTDKERACKTNIVP